MTQHVHSQSLLRVLGLAFGIAVVVGGVVGLGIMRTPGIVASAVPDPWLILLLWALGGALALIDGLVVMELGAQAGLTVGEPNLTRYDLFIADECFLTGTGAEIVPVVKIDGRVIGNGKPGPFTRRLVADYRSLTKTSGEPIYE